MNTNDNLEENCGFYEFLVEKQMETLPDSRIDPIRVKSFQLKLISLLIRSGVNDSRIRNWKFSARSPTKKLTKDQMLCLKKIFCDYFRNKDTATFKDSFPPIKTKLKKNSHYICVERKLDPEKNGTNTRETFQ